MNVAASTKEANGHAAGKVILLGEHAVVYDQPALAAPLHRGVAATAYVSEGPIILDAPAWGLRIHGADTNRQATALRALCSALGLPPSNARIFLNPEIPPRAGLGASAAMAGAIARALSALFSLEISNDTLFNAVQASESIFHKTPSGLDAAVSLSGNTLLFSKSGGTETVAASLPKLILVHSGIAKDTARAVERFAARKSESPDEASRKIFRIGELARLGAAALRCGDTVALGALMTENHAHLQWFDVSCAALDLVVDIALSAGALGAKLTGGGRGGSAVILPGENSERILAALTEKGFETVIR